MNSSPPGKLHWPHAAILIAMCVLMFGVGLGWRSFASSEGHRVAPAWEMLASGDWWRVSMFGQAYLRKPPGMPWAIAAMSSVFGQTEFAARSVSALSMTPSALAAWWFASRWFGSKFGIVAGLGFIVMPQLWAPARSAEIEALNNLGTLLACFAIIDRVLAPPASGREPGGGFVLGIAGTVHQSRGRLDRVAVILLGAAGLIIAILAKGPASAPILAGVLIAPALRRMWSRRANIEVLIMAALAAAFLIPIGRKVIAATAGAGDAGGGAITQDASDFLWSNGVSTLGPVLMLIPMTLFSALPTSLAIMFPWGKDAREEAEAGGHGAQRALAVAQLLGVSWLVSLAIMCLLGVGNPRYAMPAACLLAPLPCYVIAGAWGATGGGFNNKRRQLARRLTLNRPLAVPVILIAAAVLTNYGARRVKIGTDGREAGRALASCFVESSDLWADGLIEARPDVLLYAAQAAAERGLALRPLWKKREITQAQLPPAGAALLLRIDEEGTERPRYEQAILDARLVNIGTGKVGRYEFRVFRVTRAGGP